MPDQPSTPSVPSAPPAGLPMKSYTSELRTMSADVGNISTGQAPTSVAPTVPKSPTPTVSVPPPPSGTNHLGRNILIVLLIVGMLGALWWLISLFTQSGTPVPTASPIPSESALPTASPSESTLSSYFPQIISSPSDKAAPTDMPPELNASLATDKAVLAYAQTEQSKRFIFIAELQDAQKARQAMQTWETNGLPTLAETFFGYDPSKATSSTFLDGTRNIVAIRYMNFPSSDMSLDWAIMTASNQKSYLIIAGSREAMFYAIDTLSR